MHERTYEDKLITLPISRKVQGAFSFIQQERGNYNIYMEIKIGKKGILIHNTIREHLPQHMTPIALLVILSVTYCDWPG